MDILYRNMYHSKYPMVLTAHFAFYYSEDLTSKYNQVMTEHEFLKVCVYWCSTCAMISFNNGWTSYFLYHGYFFTYSSPVYPPPRLTWINTKISMIV